MRYMLIAIILVSPWHAMTLGWKFAAAALWLALFNVLVCRLRPGWRRMPRPKEVGAGGWWVIDMGHDLRLVWLSTTHGAVFFGEGPNLPRRTAAPEWKYHPIERRD